MKKNLTIGFATILFAIFSLTTISSCTTDKCKGITCQNGGTCKEGNCTCTTGYEGSNCETRIGQKFAGVYYYTGTYACDSTLTAVKVESFTVSASKIFITYQAAETQPQLEADVNGMNFTIVAKAYYMFGEWLTYSGSGSLNGNTINISVTMTDGAGGATTCNFIGTK